MKKKENTITTATTDAIEKAEKVVKEQAKKVVQDANPNTSNAGEKVVATGTPDANNTITSEPIKYHNDGTIKLLTYNRSKVETGNFKFSLDLKNILDYDYVAKGLFYLNRKELIKKISSHIDLLRKKLEKEKDQDKKAEIENTLEKARNLKKVMEKAVTDFEISENAILAEIKDDRFISLLSYATMDTDHDVDSEMVEKLENAIKEYKSSRRTEKELDCFKAVRAATEKILEKENTRKGERYLRSRFGWNNALTDHLIFISENKISLTESGKYKLNDSVNGSIVATEVMRCLVSILQNGIEKTTTEITKEDDK